MLELVRIPCRREFDGKKSTRLVPIKEAEELGFYNRPIEEPPLQECVPNFKVVSNGS